MSTRSTAVALFALLITAACPAPVDPDPGGDAGTDPPESAICEETAECPERHICQGGVCVDVGADGCTSRAECTGNNVCVAGTCGPAPEECSSSDECPGDLVCDGFSRSCVSLNGGGDTDAGPPPPPPPPGDDYDLSGFRIENLEHDPPIQIGILPDNTVLAPGQHLVLARNASKADFEAFWGVTLGSDVVYLDAQLAGGGVPNVNGDEAWALLSPSGALVDETAVGPDDDSCYHRIGLGDGTDPENWVVDDMDTALPGVTGLPAGSAGVVVDQWSDAFEFEFEFLQITYQP